MTRERTVRIASGVIAVLFGAAFLLYIYAHATMIHPTLTGDERRARVMERLFLQSGIAEATYVGVGFVVAGVWLLVGRPRPGGAVTG